MASPMRRGFRTGALIAICGVLACAVGAIMMKGGRRDRHEPPLPAPPTVDVARLSDPDAAVVRAVQIAREAVVRSPQSAAAWGKLGMMLLAHGAPLTDSAACFAETERLQPHEARWAYLQAHSLLESDPERAIEKLARATQLCNDRPDLPRLKLAEMLLARGRLDDAGAHFSRSLRASPGNPRAMLGLGRLAYLRGDLAAAREQLVPAATDSRTHKAASALLAEIEHRAGNRERSERLLRETNQASDDPPWPDPYMLEVERMEVGRKRNLTIASALMRANRVKEAIAILGETLQQYPASERVLLLLGLAYNMDQNWSEGEKVLTQAISVAPEMPRAYYNLGLNLAAQNRYAEAIKSFETASRLMPTDAMATFHLGRCRAQLGELGEAERGLRAALEARPGFSEAHRELGELLGKSGRRDEALKHLRNAVGLNPRDSAAARLLSEMEQER